jgi:DNA gyrase/topoisomerase IV subunit A
MNTHHLLEAIKRYKEILSDEKEILQIIKQEQEEIMEQIRR